MMKTERLNGVFEIWRNECEKVNVEYFDESGNQRVGTDGRKYMIDLAYAKYSGLIFGCQRCIGNGVIRGDEIEPILIKVDSEYRWLLWDYLFEHFRMSPVAIGKGLSYAYTTGVSDDRDECLSMFRKAKQEYLMSKEEYKAYEELPEVIDIYRGGFLDEKENGIYGLSWTTDYSVAEFFNNRHKYGKDKEAVIFHTTINKKDILAYFLGREEYEVIADIKNAEIIKNNVE